MPRRGAGGEEALFDGERLRSLFPGLPHQLITSPQASMSWGVSGRIINTRPSSRMMLPFIFWCPQQLATVRTPPAFNAATM